MVIGSADIPLNILGETLNMKVKRTITPYKYSCTSPGFEHSL